MCDNTTTATTTATLFHNYIQQMTGTDTITDYMFLQYQECRIKQKKETCEHVECKWIHVLSKDFLKSHVVSCIQNNTPVCHVVSCDNMKKELLDHYATCRGDPKCNRYDCQRLSQFYKKNTTV